MRNDARPIGEDSPASPVGGHESPARDQQPEESAGRDRQPPVVNRHDADKPELDHDSPRPGPGAYHPE